MRLWIVVALHQTFPRMLQMVISLTQAVEINPLIRR
jgi:hypothetical protein